MGGAGDAVKPLDLSKVPNKRELRRIAEGLGLDLPARISRKRMEAEISRAGALDLSRPVSWEDEPDEAVRVAKENRRRALRLHRLREAEREHRKANRPGPSPFEVDAALCSRDFRFWAENYGWLYNPRDEEPWRRFSPLVLWPKQREFVEWLVERVEAEESAIVPKSREVGITWLCLHVVLWWWLFEEGFSAILGSRKEDLVDKRGDADSLFEKLRFVLYRQPKHLVPTPPLDHHLTISREGAEIVGEATNPHFGRGKRRRVAMIDEAAAVQQGVFSATWRALESTALSTWLVYNVGEKDHQTYRIHHEIQPKQVFEIDWTADPRRGDDFLASRTLPRGRLTPAEVEQEYCLRYGAVVPGRIFDVKKEITRYDEEDGRWAPIAEHARWAFPGVGGWDFGSGPSLLCCFHALVEKRGKDELPVLWIDNELTWRQTAWDVAAADTMAMLSGYGSSAMHFGDPAGRQRESDQQSWETNLRGGGVPLFTLPAFYNTREGIEWGIKRAQFLLDSGAVRVHRRCRYLWSCLDTWRRAVPDGLEVDHVSRAYIPPRHDVYSHGGMAFLYLIEGFLLWLGSEGEDAEGREPPGFGEDLEDGMTIAEFLAAATTGGTFHP